MIQLDDGSELQRHWTDRLVAHWAGQRAAAMAAGGDGAAWLTGPAAKGVVCDAVLFPLVTAHPDLTVLDDLLKIATELNRYLHPHSQIHSDSPGDLAGSPYGTAAQTRPDQANPDRPAGNGPGTGMSTAGRVDGDSAALDTSTSGTGGNQTSGSGPETGAVPAGQTSGESAAPDTSTSGTGGDRTAGSRPETGGVPAGQTGEDSAAPDTSTSGTGGDRTARNGPETGTSTTGQAGGEGESSGTSISGTGGDRTAGNGPGTGTSATGQAGGEDEPSGTSVGRTSAEISGNEPGPDVPAATVPSEDGAEGDPTADVPEAWWPTSPDIAAGQRIAPGLSGQNPDVDAARVRELMAEFVGGCVKLLSGEPGLAAYLRRNLLADTALDGKSLPLDVGDVDDVPWWIRRAVTTRDQRCTWPGGCDQPAAATQPHHVIHRFEHGATAVGNLSLLCFHHHVVVHRWGWNFKINGDGSAQATSPDGRVYRSSSRPPPTRPG